MSQVLGKFGGALKRKGRNTWNPDPNPPTNGRLTSTYCKPKVLGGEEPWTEDEPLVPEDDNVSEHEASEVDKVTADIMSSAAADAETADDVTVVTHSSAAAGSSDGALVWPWTAIYETLDGRNLGFGWDFDGRGDCCALFFAAGFDLRKQRQRSA